METRAVFPDCPESLANVLKEIMPGIMPDVVVHYGAPIDEGEAMRRISGHKACVLFGIYVSDALLEACADLRTIVYLSTGVGSHVDLVSTEKRGVRVRNVTSYAGHAIAEHILALMLDAARRVSWMDRTIRGGGWERHLGFELKGRTLGVIGLGDTGVATAKLAAAIGMNVVACSRSEAKPGTNVTILPLDEVLQRADIVSLHLALNNETTHILNARRIRQMRPGSILVNTARAGLIDGEALVAALLDGHIAHACLDVFDQEPPSKGDILTQLDNVTLTSHAAWSTHEAAVRLLRQGLMTLRDELKTTVQ
jgi:D-3-phosphoglycerate dehydrogenase